MSDVRQSNKSPHPPFAKGGLGGILGFHFNADNCIGCHSCESACSEKNNLPPHIAWRKVGFLEGGQFPDVRRMNISMACNHCENPVCLKGCPTRAFVKLQDTGAVIQDSETCFGCRYCTWVCPYNAPAYNPDTGSVSKCNMCVDRLSVGLKPACVDACLGHALDFGEVGRMEENHDQTLVSIPGFPDPSISSPNIRFQHKETLPETLSRTDDLNTRQPSAQGLTALRSGEDSLVIFTLLTQMVVGGITLLMGCLASARYFPDLLPIPNAGSMFRSLPGISVLLLMIGLLALGMGLSTAHLGKPWRCYRALNNLRYSWVSREILFLGGLFVGLSVTSFLLFSMGQTSGVWIWIGGGTVFLGWAGIFSMAMIYRIPARPFWNHPNTLIAFLTSGLILGPLFLSTVFSLILLWVNEPGGPMAETLQGFATLSVILVLVSVIVQQGGTFRHLTTLQHGPKEGAESRALLLDDYGNFFRIRLVLSGLLGVLMLGVLLFDISASVLGAVLLTAGFVLAWAGELIGRALFYVVVIPMTLPGALFLKNKRFESYARETGLAEDPCAGVPVTEH